MTTLRERFIVMAHELGLSPDEYIEYVVDCAVGIVADWLQDDETRAAMYDGMLETGQLTKNVSTALVRLARDERDEGDEDGAEKAVDD